MKSMSAKEWATVAARIRVINMNKQQLLDMLPDVRNEVKVLQQKADAFDYLQQQFQDALNNDRPIELHDMHISCESGMTRSYFKIGANTQGWTVDLLATIEGALINQETEL